MKIVLKALTLSAIAASASSVSAGEFFVGLTAGQSNFSELNKACDDIVNDNRLIGGFPVSCRVLEDSATVAGINAGYNFNRIIGVEVGYLDLGDYKAEFSVAQFGVPATAELDLAYAGVVLSAPITESFSVSARIGGVNANADVTSLAFNLEVEDETSAFVGASIDYKISDHFSFQVRYDDLDVVDITSAGVRYHF